MKTLVWDVYARCYDVVARLQPYQRMVLEVVGEVPAGAGRVLDAGCGTGNLTRALTESTAALASEAGSEPGSGAGGANGSGADGSLGSGVAAAFGSGADGLLGSGADGALGSGADGLPGSGADGALGSGAETRKFVAGARAGAAPARGVRASAHRSREGAPEIVAVDLSAVMVRRSRRKNPGAEHVRADLDGDLAELAGKFDAIVCGNVLYALKDPARTVQILRKRLKPGGRLILTTPRAGAQMLPILRQHLAECGVLSLWRFVLPLLVVGAINTRLLRTSAYHFLTREQLQTVLGGDAVVRPTYADQAWLAICPAPQLPLQL